MSSKDKPGRERRKPKTDRVTLTDGGELRVRGLKLSKGQRAALADAAEQVAKATRAAGRSAR